jgi:hypothetical protein
MSALLISLACSLLVVGGDVLFAGPRVLVPGAQELDDVLLLDLDGDSLPELVVADNAVRVLRNLGDGTFGAVSVNGAPGAKLLDSGDVNGDGLPDVLATGANSTNGAHLLLGNGSSLNAALTTTAAATPRHALLVDANGDGDLDMLLLDDAGALGSQIETHAGDGTGALGPWVLTPLPSAPWRGAVGDLDEDGDVDLVYTDMTNNVVEVLFGNGDLTFTPGLQLPADPGGFANDPDPNGILAGDVDLDGHLDLAWANDDFNGRIEVRYGDGTGAFPVIQSLESDYVYPGDVELVDVDRDGQPDLVASVTYVGAVFLANGPRSWDAPLLLGSGYDVRSTTAADVDADGAVDVLVPSASANEVAVYRGLGGGALDMPPVIDGPSYVDNGRVIEDLDGDGDLDLAFTDTFEDEFRVLLNDGAGTFTTLPPVPTTGHPWFLAAGDVDEDGVPDLGRPNQVNASITVLHGVGDGTFTNLSLLSTGNEPRVMEFADLDGDGHQDIAVVDEGDATVSVFAGAGDGSFAPRTVWPMGLSPQSLLVHDLDVDGALDLAIGNRLHWYVHIRFGNGDGSFGFDAAYVGENSIDDVEAADFDGDGLPELAIAHIGDAGIQVAHNTGLPGFFIYDVPVQLATLEGGAEGRLAVGDVDLDGHLDLAFPTGQDSGVEFHRGQGDGTFTDPVAWTGWAGAYDMELADLDGDGSLDILSESSEVTLLFNRALAPWCDTGPGLAGSDGIPHLVAGGTLGGGTPVTLDVDHALPGALSTLVLGLSELALPLKGGVLVPAADILVAGLAVAGDGTLAIVDTWPAGLPSGVPFWIQFWVVDPAGPKGVSATGGVRGRTP